MEELKNIKYCDMTQQKYIDALVNECNKPYYNIDKITQLLQLTNGPNVMDSNYMTPIEAAYECAAEINRYTSNHNMFYKYGIDKNYTLKLNFELIKFLVEQHGADCKRLRLQYVGGVHLHPYLMKHGALEDTCCIIL